MTHLQVTATMVIHEVAGGGDSSVFERRTRDRKVAGSNPGMSGGGIFFSRVSFCADSYFDIRSTPMLPYYQVKDPGHSAKSAGGRFQVKHMRPTYVASNKLAL